MRILSGYHFRDMHQVILSRKKRQTQQVEQRVLYVYKIAACFVFDFPLRIRFVKDHHSDNHWIYLVIQYQIIIIALMRREKTNKTSKTLSVVCTQ